MREKGTLIDDTDKQILAILQRDGRTSMEKIGGRLNLPKSTVFYRVKRLESEGIIEGYYARVNPQKVDRDFVAVVLVKAKYEPDYHETVGKKLEEIPGVQAVYFVLGDIDFIVLTRAKNRQDFVEKLAKITKIKEIERTSTQVVAKIIKEDYFLEL